jgi:exodeoxyribonuclease VII large subunit
MSEHYSLRQLNMMVREAIETELPDEYWVEAELSECRENSGHCYMELIEKDERTNTPIARASAKCWRQTWQMAKPYFERTTGQQLRAGMKVLLKVYAQFHEAYGFSWIVSDIDPTYTLGDMARKRQEIIRQLKEEGVFDLQRELRIPTFAKRIAVISAQNAAGYGDFCRQLEDNDYGFRFEVTLFPAIMQGEQVESSIIAALNAIYEATVPDGEPSDPYDCVVIIRGGGATADLSGFDTLALAENVAQFPLPVITGIGHDRDESILDMVSHTRVKTPTAAAAFLIDQLQAVMERIETAEQRITHQAQVQLSLLHSQLSILSERIPTLFSLVRTRHEARINQLSTRLSAQLSARLGREQHQLEKLGAQLSALTERRLLTERHRLEMLEQRVASLDPQLLLKRGYSITLYKGKAVRNTTELKTGDKIETRLSEGTIKSIVT